MRNSFFYLKEKQGPIPPILKLITAFSRFHQKRCFRSLVMEMKVKTSSRMSSLYCIRIVLE